MRLADYLNRKIIELAGGLSEYGGIEETDRLIFINDKRSVMENKLKEYDVWYQGDSDELLNFYTVQTNINYNYEPWYDRNKRGYFWSIASTENDIKRTHSGQPRNIVDTLVSLIGCPEIYAGMKENKIQRANEKLSAVLEDNEFWETYIFEQMPMTLVEGWGCYKIDWNKDISDYPIIKYYRAKDVEFVYQDKRMCAIIFKDFYTDGKFRNYLITETRAVRGGNLYVRKDVFKLAGDDIQPMTPDEVVRVEELADLDLEPVIIDNFKKFLAVPCIFYKDVVDNDGYGRSIFTGKVDLFDDLDQCLSQGSNTVRRSTPVEYFNTDFLERDPVTKLPKMPHVYDRKYTSFVGGRTVDGVQNTTVPVQVTQPQLQFNEYNTEAQNILLQIISGIMSPATLGIDVAKKDNADAQREKEKITIFTRNVLIKAETKILKNLFNQVLAAVQLMNEEICTCIDYSISVKYSEFADDSFENKLQKLGEAYVKGTISTDMYLDKLYGDSLSSTERDREYKYLKEKEEKDTNPFDEVNGAGDPPVAENEEDEEFDMGDEKPGFKGVDEGAK